MKESSLSRSSCTNMSPTSRSHVITEHAPAGRSAQPCSTSAIINAPIGVFEAGLSTKGQPAAIAGAILCAARLRGELKGETMETTPMGKRRTIDWIPALRSEMSSGAYSPYCRTASSAAISNVSISRVTSPRASVIGFPASRHSANAKSSKRVRNSPTQ